MKYFKAHTVEKNRAGLDTAYIVWDGEPGTGGICLWVSDDTGCISFYSGPVIVEDVPNQVPLVRVGHASFRKPHLQETTEKEFLTVIGAI